MTPADVKRVAALLIPAFLAGCSGGGVRDSAPARSDIDFSRIPDAVPRTEPPSRYGNPASYSVAGQTYRVRSSAEGFVQRGTASWYGTKFHGRRTSSGEPYDMYRMTAAHKTLPLPTYVQVTNLENGRTIVVKVNDRGPFHDDRIIDLSYAAARKLAITGRGTARVEIRAITPAQPDPLPAEPVQAATTAAPMTPTLQTAVLSTGNQPIEPIEPAAPAIFLQVGAFLSRSNAEQLRQRLQEAVSPVTIQTGDSPERTLYRVRVGPLPSEEEADALVGKLVELGVSSPRVIRD